TSPALTRREHDVLLALCGPMFSGDVFREPASTRQIATELVVTEAAVKQHLSRLYDKFGIFDQEARRQVALLTKASPSVEDDGVMDPDPIIGTSVAGYSIESVLGRGAMGVVYA